MKTVFIVNPMAGKGNNTESLICEIRNTAKKCNSDYEIHITTAPGEAEEFVREYSLKNGAARFIACGGDGTLSEVLNGALTNCENEVGVMPLGTGNDFCRNFNPEGEFTSAAHQLMGESVKCDAIRYTTFVDGIQKTGYCINMVNIGFDCNVADMTATMKKKPFIFGPVAYFLSIFAALVKKKGANLKIELDGDRIHSGPMLLTSVANGNFCGGGIKSNPLANVSDGQLNVNIIYNISRLNFLSKLPFYMKGTHINLKGIEKIIFNAKCKKMTVTPLDKKIRICIDGEITDAGKTEFEIVHNAFNFVLPSEKAKADTKQEFLHI